MTVTHHSIGAAYSSYWSSTIAVRSSKRRADTKIMNATKYNHASGCTVMMSCMIPFHDSPVADLVTRATVGELESWRVGELERWRGGEVESWKVGEVERS